MDWTGGFVRLEPGQSKNRGGRAFPITPALRQVLERRLEVTRRVERAQSRMVPFVFHRKGEPLRSMAKSWRSACKAAGVPGGMLHDLRRRSYRRYAIVAEADLREAGAKLAALIP